MTSIYVKNVRAHQSSDEDMSLGGGLAVAAVLIVLCALSAAYATPALEFIAPFDPTFVSP